MLKLLLGGREGFVVLVGGIEFVGGLGFVSAGNQRAISGIRRGRDALNQGGSWGLGSIRVSLAALFTAEVNSAYGIESEEQAVVTLVWKDLAFAGSLRPIRATFGVGFTLGRSLRSRSATLKSHRIGKWELRGAHGSAPQSVTRGRSLVSVRM